MTRPQIVCIMGPTACGKTDLAVRLAREIPFDIISVDSALVYKGMDIGTAKPSSDILAKAPHRLIDFLDPLQPYSAANFCHDALREIQSILQQNRIPLLVGGTMLYFRALLQGMAELPAADAGLRAEIAEQAQQRGWSELHRELSAIDPDAAARIHPNDPQRIGRALEVFRITGVPISQWQRQQQSTKLPYASVLYGLMPSDRAVLHERIAARFNQMLQDGFVSEVERLRARGDLTLELPSMRAVGYRQVWGYLDGLYDYQTMVQKGIQATRQLAKRQMTWLRSMSQLEVFDCLNKDLADMVLKDLKKVHIN